MVLNKCCCCIKLQTGCIILAVVGIIVNLGFFGLAGSRCITVQVATGEKQTVCFKDFYVIAAGNVIGIIGCVCLLFGSIKKNRIAVLVYLAAEIIRTVLYFANAIMMIKFYADLKNSYAGTNNAGFVFDTLANTALAGGICVMLALVVSIYFWICVFSFFRKL